MRDVIFEKRLAPFAMAPAEKTNEQVAAIAEEPPRPG
jgi:hypothetical protein